MPFKSLSKFTFFSKKSAKKEAPLNNLAYDYTIPAIEKLEIIDKEKIKLEVEDRDRINRLESIDKTIEQAIKNRDQLEKDLEIARVAKDKSNSELIKAEQEFVDNFKTKFALIKQEKTLKKESIVKIEFILSKVDIMNVTSLDLSHSDINDFGAKYMADSLVMGRFPHLKSLNVSDNQITPTGEGYFPKALNSVNQTIAVVLTKVQGFSKEALKATMKTMLSIAKNNGISTKEMLTTDETIEHCIKGVPNVALNIGSGVAKCTITPLKYFNLKDVTLQDIGLDILSYAIPQVKVPIVFTCITQSTFFSVVDEEFSNCLVGVDSLLNE